MPMDGGAIPVQSTLFWDSVTKSRHVSVQQFVSLAQISERATGQSPEQLDKEFRDIRNTFNGRYVRLYAACDKPGF